MLNSIQNGDWSNSVPGRQIPKGSLLKHWPNSCDEEVFAIIFRASNGKLLKKIKYIKTEQINLREWQKWWQLLILYINIATLQCYAWESRMYSNNYQALNSMGTGYNCIHMWRVALCTDADILGNSNNLLYHYKFGICIHQKYQYDISQLCIPRWQDAVYNINQICQGYSLMRKPSKCVCVYLCRYQLKFSIVTNVVSNIYRTTNEFFPNTIIYLTR